MPTITMPSRPRQRAACRADQDVRPAAGALASVELRDLWRRHTRDGDASARDRLVFAYAPLAKWVAGRMLSGLPAHVDEADLISYGLGGLIRAIDRYEPEREVRFETYAVSRIKGAIIDELRSLDWVPRSVRARAREIERATVLLERELHRAPTEDEVAEEIGATVAELRDALLALSRSSLVALDGTWSSSEPGDDDNSLMDTLEDPNADDPARALEAVESKDRIARALGNLPDRERLVLALYYYEGLNLREIGDIVGVTESRVSQLRSAAILRMRGRLVADELEDLAYSS